MLLCKHFGVVSTDLPGEKTPVTTGLNATIAGFFSASTLWPNLKILPEMRDRAWEALERMEATYLADRLVGHMSAGEKRRIMIARSLVHRPEMLLLDEPSNALDLAAQRDLRRILARSGATAPAAGCSCAPGRRCWPSSRALRRSGRSRSRTGTRSRRRWMMKRAR